MKRYIKSEDTILASSFNRAITQMNNYPCAFITAFRDKYTHDENKRRNRKLEAEIKSTGLTYIKSQGGYIENKGTENEKAVYEDTFCVIDNKYDIDDFIDYAISWCKEFDQDGVLVTEPTGNQDKDSRQAVFVTGIEYNKNGGTNAEYKNVEMSDISQYFTRICGKSFTLVSASQR